MPSRRTPCLPASCRLTAAAWAEEIGQLWKKLRRSVMLKVVARADTVTRGTEPSP